MKMNRYNFNKIVAVAVACLTAFCVNISFAQEINSSANSRWNFSDAKVERSADGKKIELSFSASPKDNIKSQEIVYAYPSLVSADGKKRLDFAPFQVAGSVRYKVINRKEHFGNRLDPQMPAITNLHSEREAKATPLKLSTTADYKPWMKNSVLVVKELVYGCAECGKDEALTSLAESAFPRFSPEDYIYNIAAPENVTRKYLEDSVKCMVNFIVNKWNILENFKNNAQELATLRAFVERMSGYTGAEINHIKLVGSASPESPMAHNIMLSENRAAALESYIAKKYPSLDILKKGEVVGIGEDWDGLYEAVATSDLDNREQIMRIIKRYDTDIPRERDIKAIDGGKTYKYLLDNVYPQLRYTKVSIRLSVRPYNDDELADVFKQNPRLLSSYELYNLAAQMEKAGKSPVEIYKTALNQEDNITNRLNYALALMKFENNGAEALNVLSVIQNDSRAKFPMAMALNMMGKEDEAEAVLRELANSGDADAKRILNIE